MTTFRRSWVCALVALVACSNRTASRDAGARADVRDSAVVRTVTPDASTEVTVPSSIVWHAPTLTYESVSNALLGSSADSAVGLVAAPSEDLSTATLRLVRWTERGVADLATHAITGTFPGGPLALLRRASGGYTAVWFPARRDPDGGTLVARALDATDAGFEGEERDATDAERSAAMWASGNMAPRRRTGIHDVAPAVTVGDVRVSVDRKRENAVPEVHLDQVEVTRGTDLEGFEPSVGVGVTAGARRWVAVARGRCQQARIDVYLVEGGTVTLRQRLPLRTEVGVRWIRVDARDDEALVTWYQSLIPLRIDCIRGANGATLADHGVRVARVKASGTEPLPIPEALAVDASVATGDGAVTDASVEGSAISDAGPATSPRTR